MNIQTILAGQVARIDGSGPLADAITDALERSGAYIARGVNQDRLNILVTLIEPIPSAPLSQLDISDYDRAFDRTMASLYAALHAAVPLIKASGGGSIVTVMTVGRSMDDPLTLGLADGVESITAGFASTFAVAPDAIRTNGIRIGGATSADERRAVGETVAVLASDQSSYMNGMTVPLHSPARPIAERTAS